MLKKSASFVLASLKASTYEKQYASAFRLLRPCWTAFLTILQARSLDIQRVPFHDRRFQEVFQQPVR
jgi:hypothetical protein